MPVAGVGKVIGGGTAFARLSGVRVAVAALALILGGCLASAGVVQVSVSPLAPQYVRGQIIRAMEAAGYQKIYFKSYESGGDMVPEIRSAGTDEYRFSGKADPRFVAKVFFDKVRSEVTVRLMEEVAAGSGRAELERIREALGNEFGT